MGLNIGDIVKIKSDNFAYRHTIGWNGEIVKFRIDIFDNVTGYWVMFTSKPGLENDQITKNGNERVYCGDELMVIERYKVLELVSEAQSIRDRINRIAGWDESCEKLIREIGSGYEIVLWRGQSTGDRGVCIYHGRPALISWLLTSEHKPVARFDFIENPVIAIKEALFWVANKNGKLEPQPGDETKAEIEGKTYKVKILERV